MVQRALRACRWHKHRTIRHELCCELQNTSAKSLAKSSARRTWAIGSSGSIRARSNSTAAMCGIVTAGCVVDVSWGVQGRLLPSMRLSAELMASALSKVSILTGEPLLDKADVTRGNDDEGVAVCVEEGGLEKE